MRKSGVKRYSLALPADLYDDLQRVAQERNTTVVELLRRFIKLGLFALEIEDEPGSALIIREGEKEREILMF